MEAQLLTRREVERKCSLSRSGIYKLMEAGRFPRPLKLGVGPAGSVRWLAKDVDEFILNLQYTNGEPLKQKLDDF